MERAAIAAHLRVEAAAERLRVRDKVQHVRDAAQSGDETGAGERRVQLEPARDRQLGGELLPGLL